MICSSGLAGWSKLGSKSALQSFSKFFNRLSCFHFYILDIAIKHVTYAPFAFNADNFE